MILRKPIPTWYGKSISYLDYESRIRIGGMIEWNILKVVHNQMLKKGQNIKLSKTSLTQNINGTDGIFEDNGVEELWQSKSRTRKYSHIGIELFKFKNVKRKNVTPNISNIDLFCGRDRTLYDKYCCLVWETPDKAVIYVINGNHQREVITNAIDIWKSWVITVGWQAMLITHFFIPNEEDPLIEILCKIDDKDLNDDGSKFEKIIGYFSFDAYIPEYITKYKLTRQELDYIYTEQVRIEIEKAEAKKKNG